MEARVEDLFKRAQSLGYTDESAIQVADCFTNWDHVTDPCAIHPNHSVSTHNGYAVDQCEACKVIELSNAEGFTVEGFKAAQAKRAAEYAAIEARDLSADQGAFAEAERDEMSGIDMIRELTAIPTGQPTRKAPKLKVVHAADLGTGDDKTTACGKAQVRGRVTMVPESVTCKLCKGTQRFQRWATNTTWRLREAEFARAGLRREMVIRETSGAGRFGVIARIESGGIEIYFWTPDQAGKTYRAFATVAAFDEACEFVILDKMIKVGDRLVSVLGGESVVLGVTSTSVRYRQLGTATPVDVTIGEFAAELSRGWLAVVPTTQCRACNKMISNTQDHKHFDRPMSWPGQPERPKGLYIRPDGTREAVTTDDMAEKGMRVTYGHGFADNGTVVEVTWHLIVVKRDKDGTTYTLSLRDLLRLINRGEVSTFMPDANGRPIGSWR